jgi:hypothetical protein
MLREARVSAAEALNWFIRLAVSPEPEQDRLTMNPQGSCRNKLRAR